MTVVRTVFAAFVAILMLTPAAEANEQANQKAVLVTGATSGIGLRIAEELAANGYFVYAGARKPADIERLDAKANMQAIRLDVTSAEDIERAVATIRDAGRGLFGLINNAGVLIGGPVVDVDVEEAKWLFDVNVFGVYRVTQAFAPLIIESQGRIVTISSISGIGSGPLFSHYSMSKHAVEAFTDSLAAEMQRFGVAVSAIEPGNYNSNIVATALQRMTEKGYANEDSLYADAFAALMQLPADRSIHDEPDAVAEAALHALSDEPLRRYMVVPNAREADWAIRTAVRELVELNAWHAYSFSREELIAMLDEALAGASD